MQRDEVMCSGSQLRNVTNRTQTQAAWLNHCSQYNLRGCQLLITYCVLGRFLTFLQSFPPSQWPYKFGHITPVQLNLGSSKLLRQGQGGWCRWFLAHVAVTTM